MAHIENRNQELRLMLIMIVCIGFATIAAKLLLRYALTARTKNSKNNTTRLFLFAFAGAFYIYRYLSAALIKFAVSRTRKFQADATAALITRNSQGLINALKRFHAIPQFSG
jgi:heat shock protein HtpX